ncbi:MAG TPA: 6-carboxytetrahydropterin synthase [Candidatus Dormibacteraeota bacterium]|nr:6-carboxytetrahydropterin synthase [Candidatus Dormibacteraeota bacterium]
MYEVGVVDQFEAAHRLQGNFGPATRRHGHTYRVELRVRGAALAADGTLCDIGQLGDGLRAALGALNYQDLDELPAFSGRNTTAEAVATHILQAVRGRITTAGLKSIAVLVWESPSAFASYEEEL